MASWLFIYKTLDNLKYLMIVSFIYLFIIQFDFKYQLYSSGLRLGLHCVLLKCIMTLHYKFKIRIILF